MSWWKHQWTLGHSRGWGQGTEKTSAHVNIRTVLMVRTGDREDILTWGEQAFSMVRTGDTEDICTCGHYDSFLRWGQGTEKTSAHVDTRTISMMRTGDREDIRTCGHEDSLSATCWSTQQLAVATLAYTEGLSVPHPIPQETIPAWGKEWGRIGWSWNWLQCRNRQGKKNIIMPFFLLQNRGTGAILQLVFHWINP